MSIQTSAGPPHYRYNRASIERALTIHFGAPGTSPHTWSVKDKSYIVPTSIGLVELRTLREAALFVIACAEKGRRIERAGS